MDEVSAELDRVNEGEVDEELDDYTRRFTVGTAKGRVEATAKGPLDDEGPPFDVRVPRPQIFAIAKLCELAKVPPPPEPQPDVACYLVVHGITPFHHPDRNPGGVWGLGYEAEFLEPTADTISYEPGTTFLTVGKVGQRVNVGLAATGELTRGGPVGATPVPVGVSQASFRASTSQELALTIELSLRLLKVQGGPFGNGGAKWNTYRQDERIDAHQVLLQTVRMAKGVKKAKIRTTTWTRRSGIFGWRRLTWEYKPIDFDIDVIG